MKRYKRYIKDSTLIGISNLLVSLKGLIMMPLIIKSAGVAVYGGYGLAMSILCLIFGISSLGVDYKYRRKLPSTDLNKSRAKIFYPQFYFQLMILIIFSFLALSAYNFFNDHINLSLKFSPILIPIYFLTFFIYSQVNDYFRYSDRILNMTIQGTFYHYLFVIFAIFFSFYKTISIDLLILSGIFSSIIVTTPLLFKMINELKISFILKSLQSYYDDIKLGIPIILGYMLDFLLVEADRYIIAGYMSIEDVGYYTAAYGIGSIIVFFPKLAGGVLPQFLSKALDLGRKNEANVVINYSLKVYLLIGIPFIVGSFVMSKTLLTLLANEKVAEKAFLVMPIIASAILFYGLAQIINNIFFANMKTKIMMKMDILTASSNLILNLILLYFFRNIIIAATTTLISYILMFSFSYWKASSIWGKFNLAFKLTSILKIIIASVLMGVFTNNINNFLPENIIGFIVGVLISIIIYFFFLLLFKAIKISELKSLQKIIFSNSNE